MKKLLILTIICLFSKVGIAQQKSLDEITSFKIRNSGSFIDENKDVDGYYFYYEVDKLKKGKREYAIKMMDNNLNDIATKSYIDDKNTFLAQSKFNNQSLMFAMVNSKEKTYKLVTFDKKGNQGKDIVIPVSKKEIAYFEMMIKMQNFNLLTPIDNNGFIFNYIKKNKKLGYGLKYIATNGGKSWDYNSPEDAKMIYSISPIEANEEVVVLAEASIKSMLSSTSNMKIVVLETKTGNLLFEKEFNRDENPRIINNSFLTKEKNIVLVGEYFKKGDNIVKSESEGLFSQVLDLQGNVLSDNLVSWENDIDKMMPADSDGKTRNNTYIMFHDIVRTQAGDYYMIGEKYRKTLSAAGLLLGGSKTQLTITDAVMFKFDGDFKLKDIIQIDKGKSRAQNLMDYGSPQMNARILKAYGAFDYEYTQLDKDRDRFYTSFIDYERLKDEKNKFSFKTIMYSDGEFKEDKIYLSESKGKVTYRVLPGKLGYIMLLEYNKKEKSLDIHLEKLNF